MSDLIERQAAIEAARRHEVELPLYSPKETDIFWNDAIDVICNELESLPSAEPKIIHCRDCEYGEIDQDGWWFCTNFGGQVGESDGSGFCADAEKRR